MKRLNQFTKYPIIEFFDDCFDKQVPPLCIFVVSVAPVINVSCPETINELYVTKNKYFDKNIRLENQFKCLFGGGTVFSKSNELWTQKRKHLAVAFYKEKMIKMLDILTAMTDARVKQWIHDYANQPDKHLSLIRELSDLISDCI